MGSWVKKGGPLGWVGAVPLLVASLLWLAVLFGVASPLGRWVGSTDTPAQLASDRAANAEAASVRDPSCLSAAVRSFVPRR